MLVTRKTDFKILLKFIVFENHSRVCCNLQVIRNSFTFRLLTFISRLGKGLSLLSQSA